MCLAEAISILSGIAQPTPLAAAAPVPTNIGTQPPHAAIWLPAATSAPLEVHSASQAEAPRPPSSIPVCRLQGTLGPRATKTEFMVDSGATALFLDTALAKRSGLVPQPSGRTIKLADGTIRDAAGTALAVCSLQSEDGRRLTFEAEFCVTELQGHEAILGMPWLHHFNPGTDWHTGKFVIERSAHAGGPLSLCASQAPAPTARGDEVRAMIGIAASDCKPATRSQWAKMLKKGQLDLNSIEMVRIRLSPSATAQPPTSPGAELSAADAGPAPVAHPPALAALLAEFKDVAPDKLPPVDPSAPAPGGIAHRIDLVPDAKPHAAPLRRYSPLEDAEIRRVVEEQVQLGRMRESTSPWGAMVLLAKKKDNTLRFCVDYRVLNNSTIKNRYALPLADDCFDRAQGAQFFSKLDLHTGFWQIPLDAESAPLTAFRTRFGHYEYTVLPMGLCNAPGTFMHVMNSVFRQQLDRFMLVFLDDIFVYSRTEQEHLAHLREVLEVLRSQHLYLKPSKCEWMKSEVEFLGHRVGREGLSVDPHKVDAVREWPTPKDVPELRSFLGLAGYYRRFLENYSQIALPLTELTKDDVEWTWEAPQREAFERLKHMLSNAPVLQLADPSLPYVIHCDASGYAIGACLMQDHGQGLQPVSYISAKMKPAETRYAPHEQELLALVYACRSWRHYLHNGHPFTVLSDHQSLRFFATQPILSSRQARWKDLLAEFDFTIKYIEGPKNVVADALSRRADHLTQPRLPPSDLERRLHDAKAVSRDEFLASIAIADRDEVPLSDRPCAGRGLTDSLCAAQLRGRRIAQVALTPEDEAKIEAERQKNIDAATKMLPASPSRPAPGKDGAIIMPGQRCTADAKNGKQCGARTRRGQFCFTHRRQKWGTRIQLTARGHGLGLFAARALKKGDDVAGYGGDLVLGRDPSIGGPYHLWLRIKGGGAVDAARTNAGDGRYINAPLHVTKPDGKPMTPNCLFMVPSGQAVPTIRLTRDVAAGEELFVNYGAAYWAAARRLAKQAKELQAKRAAADMLLDAAELSAATLVFGGFELIAQAREAAKEDTAYTALLASPPPGQTARDGLLWMSGRLVVPNNLALRTQLLAEMHDTPTGGHFGRDKTQAALRARFHWDGMAAQAASYVAGCDTCQRVKHNQQRIPGLLMPLPVPEDIDSHWTMDHVTGLPRTERGCDAIQGHFSRGGSIKRLAATDKTVDATRAADIFVNSVVRHHGVPASVVSDRGPQFVSHFWQALMKRLGTKLSLSTGYHAQTDGKSENEQKTLENWLRAFCQEFPADWDLMLPLAELALNSMPHAAAGVTPYQLLYGRNPALSVDRALSDDATDEAKDQLASVPAAQARWERMAAAWATVRGKLLEGQQRMARNADRHRRDVRYAVGDLVLLSTAHLKIKDAQFNAKLAHLYCGPFPVKRVINANAYELELPDMMQIHAVVNITHLRAYTDGRKQFPDRPAPPGLSRPPPETVDDNGAPVYEVERVLAQRGTRGNVRYLVLWKGYPYADATWEPASALTGAPDALDAFRSLHRVAGQQQPAAVPRKGRGRRQ